ncbi:MAG: NUDIX hydrolase [Betaproteobacteria bacterium]|nr:NUDIX hydrolase [Betaproteobacteria bacterium]MDH5211389.1 NUDIX hydrolase [Betaproteobacteria bacterium]MDH5577962.1 NUDIX hydrolase [Betaproteobacteria bacterium]
MAKQPLAGIARPLATVDLAIFTVTDDALRVLLVQRPATADEPFPGLWALPGGFVDTERDVDLEHCALRKLKEKAGIESPYLEQLGSWGSAKRDPRGWSATHAYFALVSRGAPALKPGGNAPDARWFPVSGSSVAVRLAFDHAQILAAAISRLRNKVEYTSLPAFTLPREFTLTELQRTYEVVLGRALEKSAFRTRVLAADLVRPVGRIRRGPNRPAQMYRLRNPRAPVFFARTFSPR